jgi:undecaprenyl-diphosphatase
VIRGLYDKSVRGTLEYKMGWYLILATIPVGVFGLIFSDQIETGARNLWLIASTLIGLAVLLAAAEKVSRRDRGEEEITTADAVVVGTAQAIALIPGASRSGTTITGGLFRGLTREAAARFSFLLSIPAVVLSGGYEALKSHDKTPGVGLTGVALIFAFVVGLASIHWLMRWLSNHSTFIFIYYRIALGILLIVLLSTGVLHATR